LRPKDMPVTLRQVLSSGNDRDRAYGQEACRERDQYSTDPVGPEDLREPDALRPVGIPAQFCLPASPEDPGQLFRRMTRDLGCPTYPRWRAAGCVCEVLSTFRRNCAFPVSALREIE